MLKLIKWFEKPTKDTLLLFWELLKIMVPIMIAVRIAVNFGLIDHLSLVFTPLMDLMGLPPEAGLIWTTAMLVNIYAGIVTLIGLLPDTPMNVAQITILGTIILVAHSLPIEQRICQKAGTSLLFTTGLRIVGAIILGTILHHTYRSMNMLQEPAHIQWIPQTSPDDSWLQWSLDNLISLIWIFAIIYALVLLLKLLDDLKVTDLLARALGPILKVMGISEGAIPVTMIGVLLGLGYGGALIIREAKTGSMTKKDVFLSLSFMCLFHSVIEDTLLIYAIGADLSGILIARFLFAMTVMILIAKFINVIPERLFHRFLMHKT